LSSGREHPGELVLVRHGETEWSRTGKHTGRTDVPLTDEGRRQAELLAVSLAGRRFQRVLTSPLGRAAETCRLAGFEDAAEAREELVEWDYGEYEGLTTPDIRRERPDWVLWRDGCPGGERADQVGERVDRVLADVSGSPGDVVLFAHGHVLRVLAARWLGLAPRDGALLALDTATVSVLGWERQTAVLRLWNVPPGVPVP
jgi:probable phosphoglycerate mutase